MSGARPKIDPMGKYNETDAAKLLGVDRSTLYRWRKKGYIKVCTKCKTKKPRYKGSDLLRVFDNGT